MEEQQTPKKSRTRMFLVLYSITLVVFLVYFFFIAEHTPKTHHELNKKIDNLNNKITYTKNQIGNVYTFDQLNSDSTLLEQYAREHLNMHKDDEDIFIMIYE